MLQEGVKVSIRNIILYWILEHLIYLPVLTNDSKNRRNMKVKVRIYTTVKNVVTTFTVLVWGSYNSLKFTVMIHSCSKQQEVISLGILKWTDCALCFSKVLAYRALFPHSNLKYSMRIKKAGMGDMGYAVQPTLVNFTQLCCNTRRRFFWGSLLFCPHSAKFYRLIWDEKKTVFGS